MLSATPSMFFILGMTPGQTVSIAVRLRLQEICFERSPREPKTLDAHIVRVECETVHCDFKVGIGRHSEHVVARNIFPVKTQGTRREGRLQS